MANPLLSRNSFHRFFSHFLVLWISFCQCRTEVTNDELYLMSSNRDGDFCITNSSSAMYYTTNSGEVVTNATSFNKTNFLCDFENGPNNCVEQFKRDIWTRKSSIDTPILDVRWEHFSVKKLKFEGKDPVSVNEMTNNDNHFKLVLSLIGPNASIYLCDKANISGAQCSLIELQKKNINIKECNQFKSITICTNENPQPTEHTLLSNKVWTHIIIEKIDGNISLKKYQMGKEHLIQTRKDERMFIFNYLFGQATFKIHKNNFMQSAIVSETNFTQSIEKRNNKFCVSFFLKTCSICKTSILFISERESIISRHQIKTTNDIWQHHKIIEEIVNEKVVRIRLKTELDEKPNGHEYWAFDNFRDCDEKEYRITQKSSEAISKCRLLDKNQTVAMKDAIDNKQAVSLNMLPSLASCSIFKSFGRHCDKLKICSTIIGIGDICHCSMGYIGKKCDEECEKGTYWHFCQKKCGFCQQEGMCNNVDGSCVCNPLFEGRGCHLPKEGNYYKEGPLVIKNGTNFCEIDWGHVDQTGKNEAKFYLIQYSELNNTTWSDFNKIEKIDEYYKHAKITPLDSNKIYKVRVLISDQEDGLKRLDSADLPYTNCTTLGARFGPRSPNVNIEKGQEPHVPDRKEELKNIEVSGSVAYSWFLLLLLIPMILWIVMKRKNTIPALTNISFWKKSRDSSNLPLTYDYCEPNFMDLPQEGDCETLIPEIETEQELPKGQSTNSIPNDQYSQPVRIADFNEYVKSSIESGELDRQHGMFPRGPTQLSQYGSEQMNKYKNRYNHLVAYDHSRVILEKIEWDEYSDYINANYIQVFNIERAYIATQGPKSKTVNDFWRMIWQENVKHIIMLANIYEGGKKRVHQYWPNINEEMTFQNIVVHNQFEFLSNNYVRRIFSVINGEETRQVEQLHFSSWPDHGIPLYPQNLVAFFGELLKIPLSSTSPIIVHCSAGVGRTGTILLTDISLRRAAKQGVVDMLEDLHNLRQQRVNMVDNALQYKLAHLVVLECSMGLRTNISCNEHTDRAIENLISNEDYKTQMSYLKETEWQDEAMKSIAVISEVIPNQPEKNRIQEIVPGNVGRVSLQQYPIDDPLSSYINAVKVDGFRCPDRFLVTQQPMPNTLGDFWRLVYEKEIKVIISLNEVDQNENTSCTFWPTADDSELRPVDFLLVKYIDVAEFKNYDKYSLQLWIQRESEQRKLDVVIMSFKNWLAESMKPESCDDFLSFVEEAETISRKSSNVVVTCFDGVTASGIYVALSFMIEKIKLEGECDVCFSVRTIRHNRKQFVTDEDQFLFLYDCAVKCAKKFHTCV